MRLMCRIWCTRLVPLISDPVNRKTRQRNAIEVPMPVPVAAAHHLGARHTKGVWWVENLLANAAGLAGGFYASGGGHFAFDDHTTSLQVDSAAVSNRRFRR